MTDKSFSVTAVVKVDSNNNILSSFEDSHEEDVRDLITDVFYDVDDIEITNILVKERS
jgi:hypothetical protein